MLSMGEYLAVYRTLMHRMVRCASIAGESKTSVVNGRQEPMEKRTMSYAVPLIGRFLLGYPNRGTGKHFLPLDVAEWTRHL